MDTTHHLVRAAATAMLVLAMSAGAVAAHSQTIDPNGNAETKVKPVSRAWAQAHCHAASPEVLATTAEHAANSFTPAGALPCPTEPGDTWPPGLRR